MDLAAAQQALKQYFGYDSFRPMQAEIIEVLLQKQDALVLMPTGGGKSVCYQIPALLMPGVCVVVSPLIALMKDQVEGLRANGVRAAFLNSSLSYKEQTKVIEQAQLADLDLLYVSPEKLLTEDFINLLLRIKVCLIAIDEAHCISVWGHDFRPEYTRLKFLKKTFEQVPIVALTATADRATRYDIMGQLELQEPRAFIASFDRPNLSLQVRPGRNRFRQVMEFLQLRPNQSGIIYCLTRKSTESLAKKLQQNGVEAAFYHAGMSPRARARTQEHFINDSVPIVCATIAFGMGIDKSNVRWVIHYNLPKNLEGYYQEIGRAGRDGLNSDTLLFYSYADVRQHHFFLEESGKPKLDMAKLERMVQYANAVVCRRRILLSYFGERVERDCGNCDVCQSPPRRVDGTVLVQKALSAIYRLKEQVGMNMLIDVLRGSSRKELLEKGYQQIKTYGAGRDMSALHWQHVIHQCLNLGLLEIAYDQGHSLKLTPASQEVLFQDAKVALVHPAQVRAEQEAREQLSKPKSKEELFAEGLFARLRVLRKHLADQSEIAPYLVFSDATLEEMVKALPTHPAEMQQVSGVGARKLELYGDAFIDEILDYLHEQSKLPEGYKPKGSTYALTYHLHRQGLSLEQMARARGRKPETIYSHLAKLYQDGYEMDLTPYFDTGELNQIREAMQKTRTQKEVGRIFEYFQGSVNYGKLRLGLAYWQRERMKS